jgi:hypothetical protein
MPVQMSRDDRTEATRAPASTAKVVQAGLLSWILPGAGHWLLGHRGLAAVLFAAISVPFWTGLAIGGLKTSVNPWSNPWLFLAEMGTGGYTSVSLLANGAVGDLKPQALADPKYLNTVPAEQRHKYLSYMSFYPESDVAQIYLATAGLLNILVILDAISRAQTGGLPTFREPARQTPPTAPPVPGGDS